MQGSRGGVSAAPSGLHPRASDEPDDKRVEVTHEELSGMAAMNRSHLTVTMGKLRKQGLISQGRREPLVVHLPALADYLGEVNE